MTANETVTPRGREERQAACATGSITSDPAHAMHVRRRRKTGTDLHLLAACMCRVRRAQPAPAGCAAAEEVRQPASARPYEEGARSAHSLHRRSLFYPAAEIPPSYPSQIHPKALSTPPGRLPACTHQSRRCCFCDCIRQSRPTASANTALAAPVAPRMPRAPQR